ncbi:MAG: excinuclease ABC subunit A [Elusimicrobia bacterium RIFOXYA2_FULL_50_26]|nr:MAG: excinuclease ABC subunit A [Elusimicrobia bacterium RIFOXYA2_FULL_50_26]OGS23596.1 MAG: excinuclease ABC subunit A [Elusimicrobia bacterium RIFOXYB2_FULL_50_12]
MDKIIIKGAREHNLKNISCEIPRNKLVVITGLSGSGKSSLAFDTIYAEGQRRYVESLSAYARQFLELMDKPDVDSIEGLSPAVAIEQRTPSHNPRSIVGTVTEIYDYLRLLFARIGIPHCPQCGNEVRPQSAQQIIDDIMKLPAGAKLQILSPLVRGRIGTYDELFSRLSKAGYVRARVDGKVYGLDEKIRLDRYRKHTIELVVDRIVLSPAERTRIADSVETALKESHGLVTVISGENSSKAGERTYSEHYACLECGVNMPEIEPRLFSFNSPYGACAECTGLGTKLEIDEDLVIPNKELSLSEGAILPWSQPITTRTHRWKYSWSSYYEEMLRDVSRRHGIDVDKPWKQLSRKQQETILSGDKDFEGVINNMQRRYAETESEYVKEEIYNKYIRRRLCPSCKGARLKKEALSVFIGGRSIAGVTAMAVDKAKVFFETLSLTEKEKIISRVILKEINARLAFLVNVGLGYLTLDRESATLAGGEAQRIHLATQIGSGLTGVLYVLDEPSIGLHQRDNRRLLDTLLKLRDMGNTLLVVEHDEETMRESDWIIDLGPGAGVHGGNIVAQGTLAEVLSEKKSLTARYLNGNLTIPVPARRAQVLDKRLSIKGAAQFNLKGIDVDIPLGLFVCITGVSGSGKSTLVHEVLYKSLAQRLYRSKDAPGKCRAIEGIEQLEKVIIVDQSPIGRTPRSNPATYTGAFGPIRELFAQMPESKTRGYKPGRFSFNVKGGRCENCHGDGTLKIEMQFLPDVYVHCDVCKGRRFNEETLQVKYKGRNIAEVLDMTVEESVELFANIPPLKRMLGTLNEVGLGYIKIGQPATTLSGGEAQRVKLATELSRRGAGKTLYILDEPTTGLHFADVEKLLSVLHRLVDAGNTVLVIEHNLEVIKTADWIVDLGPEGGEAGGNVVATGTPEDVARNRNSYTGRYLKPYV